MKTILTLNNLTKRFGPLTAVDNLSFKIEKGNVYGILGPNGSGKSTTLGMVLNVVNKTSGDFFWFDGNESTHNALKKVGAIIERPNFYPYMTAKQNLNLVCKIKNVKNAKIEEKLALVGLLDRKNSKFRTFSLGMKQRLAIASALLNDPEILILDEPTAGVDIELRYMLWDFLKKINEKGKTVLLTTHYIEEAEQLCDRIAIIDNGKIIIDDTTENLTEKNGESQLVIECDNLNKDINLDDINFNIDEDKIIIKTDSPNRSLPLIMEKLNNSKVVISNIEIKKNTLEQVFLKLTKNNATN